MSQLALFEADAAPIVEVPRPWTVCGAAEPVLPGWYEVQTFHRCGPDEWKLPDGYNRFMTPRYWNGSQWCVAEGDDRPSPTGTSAMGSSYDRWRVLASDFDLAAYLNPPCPFRTYWGKQ